MRVERLDSDSLLLCQLSVSYSTPTSGRQVYCLSNMMKKNFIVTTTHHTSIGRAPWFFKIIILTSKKPFFTLKLHFFVIFYIFKLSIFTSSVFTPVIFQTLCFFTHYIPNLQSSKKIGTPNVLTYSTGSL